MNLPLLNMINGDHKMSSLPFPDFSGRWCPGDSTQNSRGVADARGTEDSHVIFFHCFDTWSSSAVNDRDMVPGQSSLNFFYKGGQHHSK